ncbi:MAG TPA: hypothetical protein VFB58_14560 [Chloroflexota bacterium]|nr:hypothetical protein [Chloroflexota bacterium]
MNEDFDEIIRQAREVARHLAGVYRDITGEDLDFEGAVRHYPLVAAGAALGVGFLAGWSLSRRGSRPALPPPPAPPQPDFLSEGIDRVREFLPNVMPEDAAENARVWVDEVLEPRLREGMENVVNVAEARFGQFLRQTMQRFDGQDDRELEDPEGN